MSREVKRVPLDFNHPLTEIWPGYLMPAELEAPQCHACEGSGYSKQAQHMLDQWYGNAPFTPAKPFTWEHPAVLSRATQNVESTPEYYGTGPNVVIQEAKRLATHWDRQWGHHLEQADVDVLVTEGRLKDFTHTWTRADGWVANEPAPVVTADAVNTWSLTGMGHDSINAHIVIAARCKRENVAETCATCNGSGTIEAYPGQDAEAEAWERTEPPTGEGWQLWETTSEGSPITPVFPTKEALAAHIASPAYQYGAAGRAGISLEAATAMVEAGWAPTFIMTKGTLVQAENVPLATQEDTAE